MRPQAVPTLDYASLARRAHRGWALLQRHPLLAAALVALVVAHVVAVILFAFSGFDFWFFVWSAIFPAFTFWTVPLAAGTAILARFVPARRGARSFALALLCGIVCGFGWTLFVANSLGMFFGGFVFPPLYCWIAASVAGFAVPAAVGIPEAA
jgi:hypothetical protein